MTLDWHSYHWLLTFVQAFGVAATFMVQVHRGTHEEASYHGLFFVGLVLVGLATVAQFMLETSSCLGSGLLLVGMILGVSCDFSWRTTRSTEPHASSARSGQ